MILTRTDDRDFLMSVRNHEFEYGELMAMLQQDEERMHKLASSSTLPEEVDKDFANDLLIEIRKIQFRK